MKKKQIKASIGAIIAGVITPLAMAVPASAATQTFVSRSNAEYIYPADRGKMSVNENWESMVAPVGGDTVEFPASATYQTINHDFAGLSSISLAKIVFNGNNTFTSSKSFTITGEDIPITTGIDAIMTGNGGDHAVKVGVILGGNAIFKTTGSNSLQIGDTNKTLDLGSNTLTLDASGGTITIAGKITGSGAITKSGTGKVKMMAVPGTGGFTGSMAVPTGELTIDDAAGINVTISGGTLKGTGTAGTVTMSSGTVAPGASPGTLNTGNLTFTGGTHAVELGGKAAGEFDKLNVTGTVDLGSATVLDVSLVNSFKPAVNDSFVIIENDGSDAVSGTFKDKADGSSFTLGSYTYQINYDGGTGNDVVLLVTGTSAASAPDTGVGGILTNPITTIVAAIGIAAMLAGYRVYETKKIRK